MSGNKTQSNNTVTLSKEEYRNLKQQARAYQELAERVFSVPLQGTAAEIIADFKATNKYSAEFIADLEDGLHKSSYGKRPAPKTAQKRH
jgi:hypothetical protein